MGLVVTNLPQLLQQGRAYRPVLREDHRRAHRMFCTIYFPENEGHKCQSAHCQGDNDAITIPGIPIPTILDSNDAGARYVSDRL